MPVNRLGMLTFRRKFLLAFLIATFVPLVVFAYLSFRSTSSALHGQADRDMTGRSAASIAALDASGRSVLDQVVVAGEWNAFCAAIDKRNIPWLKSNATTWMVQNTAMKGAQVLSLDGEVISAAGDFKHASLEDSPVVVAAAAEGKNAFDFESIDGRLYIVAAGPVIEEDIKNPPRHGILVYGQPIGKKLLGQLAQYTGANEIAVYSSGRLVATSADASPLTQPHASPGTPFASGSDTVILTELPDQRGQVQGVLGTWVESSVVSITGATLRRTTGYAMVVALVIAVVLGLVTTGLVAKPLRRLAQAAAAIAGGETRQHIDIATKDEIGEVAQAFNTMSQRITQELEGMSDKIRGLSVEISNLNAFGETLAQVPDVYGELRRLTGMVGEALNGEFAALFLCEDQELLLTASAGKVRLSPDRLEDVCTRAMLGSESVNTAVAAPAGAAVSGGLTDEVVFVMAAPLYLKDAIGGVLAVGSTARSFHDDDVTLLTTVGGQIAVALQSADAYTKLDKMYLESVTALAAAMEAKDHYTAEHADSLAAMAKAVGRRLGLADAELRELHFAAVLHDIGKIGIPGSILNKPGKLTEDEFAVMAEHTVIGERILSSIEYLQPIARIVRSAHERWDGGGYPDRLAGDEIPLPSRIVLACDAFDAMTTDRPYRKAMPDDNALEELRANAGKQFDPAVVEAFMLEFGRPLRDAVTQGSWASLS